MVKNRYELLKGIKLVRKASEYKVKGDGNLDLVIGVDFGSDSARAVVIDAKDGHKEGEGICEYPRWMEGRYCDSSRGMFRQHPKDYIEALEQSVREALKDAGPDAGKKIRALSVDTTGSTPCPVDGNGIPLALLPEFSDNPNAMFYLWKDHTAIAEAAEINEALSNFEGEDYTRFQGTYSSEWYWAKILHGVRTDAKVRKRAYSWVEHCDWIPGMLTGQMEPDTMYRCSCAAGHKALWHSDFDGLPSAKCLGNVDPYLGTVIKRYVSEPRTSVHPVGKITKEWAGRLGLNEDVVIGGSSLDAHAGAVGAGIKPGILVKVVGTSTVDMLVNTREDLRGSDLKDCCGQAEDSIIPGYIGMEAGQAAFGDIYSWYRRLLMWPVKELACQMGMAGKEKEQYIAMMQKELINKLCQDAMELDDDEDLIVLDWFNGRRYPMINESVKGAVSGLTLGTSAVSLFRAIVLSTVFGSRRIFDSFITRGIKINEVITVGGIPKRSPLVMQMMADVLKRPIKVARSEQACAQGAAMYAAAAAGIYTDLLEAQEHMVEGFERIYTPDVKMFGKYDILYKKYLSLGRHIEQMQGDM